MSGWGIYEDAATFTRHVVPISDLKPHTMQDCWCGPTLDDDVWVHHAADKREEFEPAGSYEGVKRQPS